MISSSIACQCRFDCRAKPGAASLCASRSGRWPTADMPIAMPCGNRNGQRIGRIIVFGRNSQQTRDHRGDLCLVSSARAHNRLFDPTGGNLVNLQSG